MTQFTNKSFSVNMGASEAYRDNWERTFGKAAPELEHSAEQAVLPDKFLTRQDAENLADAMSRVWNYFEPNSRGRTLNEHDIETVEAFMAKVRAYWNSRK